MSVRRVKIVLVCEDKQQEAFTRRFLQGMGWNTRELRVEKSPSARGSAEQWVRERFLVELMAYRQRKKKAASGLIVMIDADTNEVRDRINQFKKACKKKQIQFIEDNDSVAIVVPKRNIETWIHYLTGQPVNERDTYTKFERERDCQPAVENLVGLCKSKGLEPDAPASLLAACNEYKARIMILIAPRASRDAKP